MELRPLVRPAARLLNLRSSSTPSLLPFTCTRGHKTTARTKRSLKIAPHDSFLPDRSAPFPAADSIIYNPPASEASPAHTPFLFLPLDDPRRLALLRMRGGADAAALGSGEEQANLPPVMRYHRREPTYHLKEEDIAEMKRLRSEDPVKWSVGHLAQKFDCSPIFVKMVSPAPAGHLDWLRSKLDRKMARWGPKKTQAREDRRRRAEMLYRGEL
ncbi:hypothetical protein RJ55_03688 [Drechmeria coniospora]|nr:hypothetical protein RJ55_03688 [Drechmeria coniospora]